MNRAIKRRWIEALRSGAYKQGRGALRNVDEFCCLGVLCDLHSEVSGNEWHASPSRFGHDKGWYLGEFDILPPDVVEWASLPDENPNTSYGALAELNDAGFTFPKIADLIEEEL